MLSFPLFAAVAMLAAGSNSAECPTKADASLMELAYDAFDTSSGKLAWRTLLSKGCVDAAVLTLETYRARNSKKLTAEQRHEMSFHTGQALAFSGRDRESIPHFESAKGAESSREWSAYVDATVAFLRKDRPRLESALHRYEKLVSPTSMRLGVIRGFTRCLDKAYMEAVHCGM